MAEVLVLNDLNARCECRLHLDDAQHLLVERVREYVRPRRNLYLHDIRIYIQVLQVHTSVMQRNVSLLVSGDLPVPVLVFNGTGRLEWVDLSDIGSAFDMLGADFFLYPRVNGVVKMQNLQMMNEDHRMMRQDYDKFLNSPCFECHGTEVRI
jgi:hypothetical protein